MSLNLEEKYICAYIFIGIIQIPISLSNFVSFYIIFIGIILVNNIIKISAVQFYNITYVYFIVCLLAKV